MSFGSRELCKLRYLPASSSAIRKYWAKRRLLRAFGNQSHWMNMDHISETDLERYYLGMIPDGPELARIEHHLLVCSECLGRAQASDDYVDAIRAAIIIGDFDLDR